LGDVVFDRSFREVERLGNFAIAAALSKMMEDFNLAIAPVLANVALRT
jgi:hypothetical protein